MYELLIITRVRKFEDPGPTGHALHTANIFYMLRVVKYDNKELIVEVVGWRKR